VKYIPMVFLLLIFVAFGIEFEKSQEQKKILRQAKIFIQKGEKEQAEKLIEPFLRDAAGREPLQLVDVPFLQDLLHLSLVISDKPNWNSVKVVGKIHQKLKLGNHQRQLRDFENMFREAAKGHEYRYVNLVLLMRELEFFGKSSIGWVDYYIEKHIKPMKKAVEQKQPITTEISSGIRVMGIWTRTILPERTDIFFRMKDEIYQLFLVASSGSQHENAQALLELVLRVSPPGEARFDALTGLWKKARSEGDIEKALSYLDCNSIEKMTAKKLELEKKQSLELRCNSLVARTLNYSFSVEGVREFLDKSDKKYSFRVGELRRGAIEFIGSLIELNRRVGRMKQIKGLLKVTKFGAEKNPDISRVHCNSLIRYNAITGGEMKEVEQCIESVVRSANSALQSSISNFGFIFAEISRFYRTLGDSGKSLQFSKKAMAFIEKNRPDRGFLKFVVYFNHFQVCLCARQKRDATEVLKKIDLLLKESPFREKLSKLIEFHRSLLNGEVTPAKFLSLVEQNYKEDSLIIFDAKALSEALLK
jgi:tetratricopeptide (TPR) repeat protein